MKKRLLIALLAAFTFLVLSAFKGGSGFNFEIANTYAVATKSSEVDTVAQRLGLEEDTVAAYFKDNSLKLLAVSEDGQTQIRISRFSDNFSSAVYDAENLTDEQTSQMISLYSSSHDFAEVIESDGRKFAKTTEVLKDSGGVYTATQYVTVAGGRIYVISCYNQGEGTSAEIDKIFSTFTAKDMSTRIASYKTRKKWIIPIVVALAALVGVSVFGLCKKLYEK